jgi:hypothetical protein
LFVDAKGISTTQKMLTEKALCDVPICREDVLFFHPGMHPINTTWGILDAVSGFGVVFHNLSTSHPAFCVNLPKYHIHLPGGSKRIHLTQPFDGFNIKQLA